MTPSNKNSRDKKQHKIRKRRLSAKRLSKRGQKMEWCLQLPKVVGQRQISLESKGEVSLSATHFSRLNSVTDSLFRVQVWIWRRKQCYDFARQMKNLWNDWKCCRCKAFRRGVCVWPCSYYLLSTSNHHPSLGKTSTLQAGLETWIEKIHPEDFLNELLIREVFSNINSL